MNNKTTLIAGTLFLALSAYAADTVIQNDKIKVGKRTSSADKVIEFDVNSGSANPKLRVNTSGTKHIQYAHDGVTFKDVGSGGGGGGGINLMGNGDFESNLTEWTASGGTLTTVTSGANLANGLATGSWTPSANSQTLTTSQYSITGGLMGKACMVKIYYKTAEATYPYTLSAIDGSSNVLSTFTLPATGGSFQNAYAPFLCPSSGSVALKISDGATVPSNPIYIDDAVVGSNNLIANLSQATMVGQVKISGCAASWTTTSTTMAAFAAATGCTYAPSGLAQAPATMIPGITFPSLPPGNYVLKAEGAIGESYVSANVGASYQFSDGTNTANEISWVGIATTNNQNLYSTGIQQTIAYTTAQSNITLSIRAMTPGGSQPIILNSAANPLVISVYRLPTTADTVFRPDSTPASWSGTSTLVGTTASATFADPGSVTGAIATVASRNMTATAAAGLVGITFNPPRVGMYQICYSGYINDNTANITSWSQLTDGSGNVVIGGQAIYGTAVGQSFPVGGCGTYNATSLSAQTLKVQAKTNGGIETVGPTSFSIVELDAPMPAPILQGTVTSSSAGIERIERATLTANCTSSPCTLASASPGILSITRASAGTYTVNFVAGSFTSAPTCTFSSNFNPQFAAYPTTSGLSISTFNNSFAATDAALSVQCSGPH